VANSMAAVGALRLWQMLCLAIANVGMLAVYDTYWGNMTCATTKNSPATHRRSVLRQYPTLVRPGCPPSHGAMTGSYRADRPCIGRALFVRFGNHSQPGVIPHSYLGLEASNSSPR
jgi:hypothetical protein